MNIIKTILKGAASLLLDILLDPAIKEEERLIAGVKARIERVNVDRRKKGEPELIVVGDTYPPSIITSEQLTQRS